MVEKKTLLISWGAHTFNEFLVPIISDLTSNYEIVIITIDFFFPEGLINKFEYLKRNGKIKSYFILPDYSKIIQQYRYLKKNTQKLKSYEFDLWLTNCEMQVNERYIKEFILPSKCIAIVLWPWATTLVGKDVEQPFIDRLKHKFIDRLKHKVNEKGGNTKVLLMSPVIVYKRVRRLYIKLKRKLFTFFIRIVLPWLFFRKAFYYGPFDQLTQFGSGRSDVILFLDHLVAKAHKALFANSVIDVVHHPAKGSCRCNGNISNNNAVLSPLSGFVGLDEIPEKQLKFFLNDFKVVANECCEDIIVHLRKHPRESGQWPNQLRDYLIANGIDAKVVGSEKAIREVMCDYLGMAGFCSNALHVARASCDYCFVIGFEAVSWFRYNEPKYAFGMGEGIGWINEDGSYDQKIFERKRYLPSKRKTVPEILHELPDKQSMDLGDYLPSS